MSLARLGFELLTIGLLIGLLIGWMLRARMSAANRELLENENNILRALLNEQGNQP